MGTRTSRGYNGTGRTTLQKGLWKGDNLGSMKITLNVLGLFQKKVNVRGTRTPKEMGEMDESKAEVRKCLEKPYRRKS